MSAAAKPTAGSAACYDVELTVTNEGKMPTALDIAKRVKMVRPDTCTITLAKGQALVQPPEASSRASGPRSRSTG